MSGPRLSSAQLPDLDLAKCLIRDRHRLRRDLEQISNRISTGRPVHRMVTRAVERYERSVALVQRRRERVPKVKYPDELPITAHAEEIRQALAAERVVILAGETGSGKTTQLPKLCLEIGRGIEGTIGHTQPRRLAARSVAARIAEELGVELGSGLLSHHAAGQVWRL